MTPNEKISYNGPLDAVIWNSSENDSLINAPGAARDLVVDDGFEAVIISEENVMDVYGVGRFSLEAPSDAFSWMRFGKQRPSSKKLFFVNKRQQLQFKWGTKGPITVSDSLYHISLHVGACGAATVAVSDTRKFILKFIDGNENIANNDLMAKMRDIISSDIKDYISRIMTVGKVDFLTMHGRMADISAIAADELKRAFEHLGLELQFFKIENIDIPRDDYLSLTAEKSKSPAVKAAFDKEYIAKILKSAIDPPAIEEDFTTNGEHTDAPLAFADGSDRAQSCEQSEASLLCCEAKNDGAEAPNEKTQAPTDSGKICPDCGKRVPMDSLFCNYCGISLKPKRLCPSCEGEATEDSVYCRFCGTKL